MRPEKLRQPEAFRPGQRTIQPVELRPAPAFRDSHRPKRILYLSQYFPPEMGAPAARVYELSREWAALGHDVTVLTGFPNHPTGVIPPEYRGQLIRRELLDGINVVRTPIYAAANQGLIKRGLNYTSYAASAAVLGPFLTARPDVVIATSPQLLTAVAGFWISALKRIPFVFEVRDLWPRSIVEVGALSAHHPAILLLEQLEMFLYSKADRIVTVTDAFVDELSDRGVSRAKMRVVKNGVDLDLFRPSARQNEVRRELGLSSDDFMCLYVGTHGMAHGLETILEAAARLRKESHVRFVLVGEGAEKAALKEKARSMRLLDSVTFVDKQARSRVALYLAASDLSLVLLRKRPLFKTVLPSKIFEIMGAGRPMILTVDGEARQLVEEAKAGVFVTPEDPVALAESILRLEKSPPLCAEMGSSGRAFVEARFSRKTLAQQYLGVLDELLVSRV
ncbi:MAG TPA: glycosyltransferase family 4 protein [Myxococcaceae bacterium]|nr:glycosyltransferase family 4 protein [Myxococcaceae bacterium]